MFYKNTDVFFVKRFRIFQKKFSKILKNQVIQKYFKKSLTMGIIYVIISPLVNPMSKNIEKIYARY